MIPLRKSLAILVVVGAALVLTPRSFVASVEAQGATLIQVDAAADRRPIDPRVYGVNWATAAQLAVLNVPVHRWGGNATTRHNWKTNGDNRGSDWYFESIPGSGAAGAAFDDFAGEAFANGTDPMVTIPLIGWVGKNGPGGSKLASFSAAKYGAQQDCDWSWFPDACNGVRTNGTLITGNDPNDANVAVNAQYHKEWAQHLVSTWGTADAGGVRYYIYDNEPSLWHHTHRDVHPDGQTMAELRDLMIAYGTAIRQADPGAVFVGPEEWGWAGYFYSGYDQKYGNDTGCWSCAPDRTANGGMEYMPWLLAQMQQHEQNTGNRLLHVFTLHYYPQSGEFSGDTSAWMQALRNRSTRSLWDPSYTDESWIGDQVRLIPLMKEWVDAHYPGLDIGITEYSWGAEDHINGATTQADVLGIFGREGLNVGTLWVTPPTGSPTFKAIQMYRNYDGQKSTFGDVSVRATGPNPDQLAVFASERTSDGALTVMAINKVTSSALVELDLANFTAGSNAQVWRLTSSNNIQRLTDVGVSAGSINTTLAAQSITLFVVPASVGALPSLSVADSSFDEGDSGTSSASFTVSLSATTSSTVTVSFATVDGSATAGSDYTAASGSLSFSPGQTSRTLTVPVLGDTDIETDETFSVTLSNPTNATIADGQGVGVIRNDDLPSVSISDASVAEGDSGTTAASFAVSLSAASLSTVTVDYATANGSATAGTDYASMAGNLTFGVGETSQSVVVNVLGDTAVEPDETFLVNLSSPVGATLGDDQGLGIISNDDLEYQLTVIRSGSGVVQSAPAGIDCGVDCGEVYPEGTAVTLTATADTGFFFAGWSGACAGTSPTCQLSMDASKQATATFEVDVPPPGGEPLSWERLIRTEVVAGTLRRPLGQGWNAGGVSSRVLVSGDGYAEFQLTADSAYLMFGLSHEDSDGSYGDIDFAIYTYPATGELMVFENGVGRGRFGGYGAGDRLRVSVDSGIVSYWRNSQLLYTSSQAPTYPLLVDTSLYSQGAEVVDARIAGQLEDRVVLPTTDILWRNLLRTTVSGSTLTRENSRGWDGGASSSQELVSGDGYTEYRVSNLTDYVMFGLSHGDTDGGYADIDYGLYAYPATGQLMVYEGGVLQATLSSYGVNDTLRVAVENGVVTYSANGVLLYSSSTPPTYPLVTDTSLYSEGATVADPRMGGDLREIVDWTHLNGVQVVNDTLTRTGSGGWTAGAISSRRVPAGSGGAEYTVSDTASYVMFGLSHGDSDGGYADIDHALYTYPNTGQLMVFENGVSRGAFGAYSPGDVLRVSVEDGVVSYFKNESLVYASLTTATYPLVLDVSLYAGVLEGARLFGNLASPPVIEEDVAWTSLVDVTDVGGTLARPSGHGWDAGAVSSQVLTGEGYVEFTVSSTADYVMFGLGNGDVDQGYQDIEYALYTRGSTGLLYVFEGGVYRAVGGAYAAGDTLRVSVEGGVVKYRRNGMLLYSSTTPPTYPLNVDTSLYSTGASVAGARIGREE